MVSVTWCCSASTWRRSTASLSTSSMSTTSGSVSGLSACSRDSSMIWRDQIGQPGRLDAHPAGEPAHRGGVVGRVLDRLGEQRDRPDRGLELVADVGHEVAPGLLDPARRGLVVGQRPRSGRPPAARPGPSKYADDARAPREICRSTVSPASARGVRPRTSSRSSGTAIRLPRTRPRVRALRRGLQHLVVRTDHDAGGVQDRQHLGDSGRHHGIVASRRSASGSSRRRRQRPSHMISTPTTDAQTSATTAAPIGFTGTIVGASADGPIRHREPARAQDDAQRSAPVHGRSPAARLAGSAGPR